MSEPSAQTVSEIEILADGVLLPVKFKPGPGGVAAKEHVKVWILGMSEMPILGAAMGDEAKEIAVVTKKDAAWVATLDDDSFEALIEEGRRLNFTRFGKYWKRQMDLLKAMGQGDAVGAALAKALEKALPPAK